MSAGAGRSAMAVLSTPGREKKKRTLSYSNSSKLTNSFEHLQSHLCFTLLDQKYGGYDIMVGYGEIPGAPLGTLG